MNKKDFKNKEYVLAEVLNHDKGPKCPDCGRPLSGLRVVEEVKPLRSGDEVYFCFVCDTER